MQCFSKMDMSHKTVFVLDHSPYFATGCGQNTEIEAFKFKGNQISKSLWTCAIESALEYRRVITDIFSGPDKLMRFVISDSVGRFMTTDWSEEAIQPDALLNNFALVGAPDPKGEQSNCCIISGLSLAVEALVQATKAQLETMRQGTPVQNCGRIVAITHIKQMEEVKMIEDHVADLIEGQNKLATTLGENFIPLKCVELCLINTYPYHGDEMKLPSRPLAKISDVLWSEFNSWRSGKHLSLKFHSLIQRHFDLGSTTISGIPMKEEQSTSASSLNYDVELLHPKEVHEELIKAGIITSSEASPMAKREDYTTLTLKWCTPAAKTGMDHSFSTVRAFRATPSEVNSRPSACLTGFVLSGRTVILELPKKNESRIFSHILTCHAGCLYIHSLHNGRSHLEDLPSVSDGPGGRVTDYRITNFVETLKECTLQVSKSEAKGYILDKSLKQVSSITKHCPLVLSDSVLFSISGRFEPLLSLVKKRTLAETDMYECKKVIFNLSSMENNGEPLTSPAQLQKIKGLKKEEQYKFVWNELESYLRNYNHYSPSHHALLNCLLQCTGRPLEGYVKPDDEIRPPIQEQSTRPAKKNVRKLTTDSFVVVDNPESPPLSPPQNIGFINPTKRLKLENDFEDASKKNLLALWAKKYQDEHWLNWKNFKARAENNGNKADLYQDLMRKFEDDVKREGGYGIQSMKERQKKRQENE